MSTERLAELLHDELLHDDTHNPVDEPECRVIAARLIDHGVRVGDPPPPADAGGLRAAAQAAREFVEWWDSPPYVIADDDVLMEHVDALRAAIAAAYEADGREGQG